MQLGVDITRYSMFDIIKDRYGDFRPSNRDAGSAEITVSERNLNAIQYIAHVHPCTASGRLYVLPMRGREIEIEIDGERKQGSRKQEKNP